MRSLVILRGSPASGKSTWVKNMGLKEYTLCADDIRLLMESPVLTAENKHKVISQANDTEVWELLFDLLRKRMSRGEFVVVDATHSRSTDFSRYNELCGRYRYRKFFVDFSDVPIEECKRRNANREPHKRVPEEVIEKMYARLKTQGKTSGYVELDKNNFWNDLQIKLFDFNSYERIHIFGDIHGCSRPLRKYFEDNLYTEKDMYIFTGDYIDRGIGNKEVLEFLFKMKDKPNVLLLEGNHERWLRFFAKDEIENIYSQEFKKNTIPQIIGLKKKDIRFLCDKLGQIAYFTFDGKKYFVSHGGIPYMPDNLQLIATEQFIKGVGAYKTDIDEVYAKNFEDTIQVHAHRNILEIDDVDGKSYNLEGKIEFGGNLKVLRLEKDKAPEMIKIENTSIYRWITPNENEDIAVETEDELSVVSMLDKLRACSEIKETSLDNNISSFNFTRDAFQKKRWNNLTTKARGLFIDTLPASDRFGKVVARGYEKFFNINEVPETELEHLLVKFKEKDITLYKKENGFLGIMSWVNDELFIASKSTNEGDFAGYFRTIYDNSDIDKTALEKYLKENDVSLTFEVIDPVNDPHIIEYDKAKLVLLDIIHNEYEFKREPYEKVVELAKDINCECKQVYKTFKDVKEFYRWYIENSDEDNMSHTDIEGVVIECDGIMTKLKFPYYNFWKKMRWVKDRVHNNSNFKLSCLHNSLSNYFFYWLKQQEPGILEKDIITLRKLYILEKDKGGL